MLVTQTPTNDDEAAKRKLLPLISTDRKGPLSLQDPKTHLPKEPPSLDLFIPDGNQDYSLAEKILLSYTSSSDHNRPPGGHSLTGLPGLVKRPGDDLTEYVLSSYRQGQLIEQAVDYQISEKKGVSLPEFHPMLKYTPHAPFLAVSHKKPANRHRKTLSAPGKYWLPNSSQMDKASRLQNTTGYMRNSLSARGEISNKHYGGWLGISQLKTHEQMGIGRANVDVRSSKGRQKTHSAVLPQVVGDMDHEKDQSGGLDNLLTIDNFPGEADMTALDPVDPSKGERKTGHVLLAPHSLTAVYVHKYHPVTVDTFLKGNTLSKSPRLLSKRGNFQGKSWPKHQTN